MAPVDRRENYVLSADEFMKMVNLVADIISEKITLKITEAKQEIHAEIAAKITFCQKEHSEKIPKFRDDVSAWGKLIGMLFAGFGFGIYWFVRGVMELHKIGWIK